MSEQARLAPGEFAAEILVSAGSGDAAAGRAIEHADLHQVRLVHFLDGVFFFAEHGGESAEADRAAGIFIEQSDHEVAVDFVEAVLVDAEHLEGFLGDLTGDTAIGANFGEVAGAAQQGGWQRAACHGNELAISSAPFWSM